MRHQVVVFEDHTAAAFRPVAWSLPVYELRCGMFNLRERIGHTLRPGVVAGEPSPGLLPRALLGDFGGPAGWLVGPEPVVAAAGDTPLLLLNGRLALRAEHLSELLLRAAQTPFAWQDRHGLLACALPAGRARGVLEHWQKWDARAADTGSWVREGSVPDPWQPVEAFPDWQHAELPLGHVVMTSVERDSTRSVVAAQNGGAAEDVVDPAALVGRWIDDGVSTAFAHLWDLVPEVGPALVSDVAAVVTTGHAVTRELFGIAAGDGGGSGAPPWLGESRFQRVSELGESAVAPGAFLERAEAIWLSADTRIASGAVLDAAAGPVVIDRSVTIMPNAYLAGPLYVGAGATIKAGATIYGETSIGAMCKIAGEVAESTFLDFGNKQHDGFIGHAYLGSWVNLGAGTTCSDLKNNYGQVRVDQGAGPVASGLQFVGVMMAEHAKTAIGTLLNTGTCVGFASNVFAAGFPPKYLPNYTWGGQAGAAGAAVYDPVKAAEVAAIVMARRGCRFTSAHRRLFEQLAPVSD